jgi:6-pyruvoyltetrahydropterin/6-carboxytetrahydropterin synthase
MKGPLYITRSLHFSAAHRLYREDWTEAKNIEVFGKCANPHGHGHNYKLEVTFEGTPDPDTGMVVHFHSLKKMLFEVVEAPLDHHHLNFVDFMGGNLPTLENLAVALWDRISDYEGSHYRLYRLVISSSENNHVEYYGEKGCQSQKRP